MSVVVNAKITSTTLGWKNAPCLCVQLELDYGGSMQGFGGWSMDNHPQLRGEERAPSLAAGATIAGLLRTVGVESWEEIKGQYVRVELTNADDGLIIRIGHIMKDIWFDPKKMFDALISRGM